MTDDENRERGGAGRRGRLRNPVIIFAVVEALVLVPAVIYLILR